MTDQVQAVRPGLDECAGVPVDRDAFVSGTSLEYAASNSVTVGLSCSRQYGRRACDSAFKGHVDVSSR